MLRSKQIKRHHAEQLLLRIDHVELVEAVRQVRRLAHVVDGVADRPRGWYGDEFGLHAPPGGAFRILEDALQRGALGRRQLLQDFGLLVLWQVFQNVGRIVGIEIADAFGNRLGRQLFEDFLAHRIFDLGECGEIELAAQQFDEARPQFGIERLDQVAGVGFVKVAAQRTQCAGVVALNERADVL